MKTHILTTTIALLTGAVFAAESAKKSESSATVTSSGGKATITIDVNGKKETREIDLGNGTEIKVTAGDGGSTVAVAGGSATAGQPKSVTWLGVAPAEASEELRAQLPLEPGSGLVVQSVITDSPAAKAGLQKNDVLMKLDDQLLTNPGQLKTLVAARKDGDTVKLTYFRRGQQTTLDVKLGKHQENVTDHSLLKFTDLAPLFQLQSKAVVVDKDGKVLGGEQLNLDATVEKIAKTLRDAGVDEKSIAEATRALADTTKAIRDAVSDAVTAKDEVQKGSVEIAKALEQVREAIEKVRRQTEEAVKKDRESRREERQPQEKQP